MPRLLTLIASTATTRVAKRLECPAPDLYTIGRRTDTTLFLNTPGISRKHCQIDQPPQPGMEPTS